MRKLVYFVLSLMVVTVFSCTNHPDDDVIPEKGNTTRGNLEGDSSFGFIISVDTTWQEGETIYF